MTSIAKRTLKGIGILAALLLAYVGAAAWTIWSWQSTDTPLPAATLAERSIDIRDDQQADLAERIQAEMIELARDHGTPSLSGALAIGTSPVWAGTVGLADAKEGTAARIDHQYRIGSISKALTATALARMVEAGVLSLDDEVQEHLPDWPRSDAPMTVRQLASHTAGIRHYAFDPLMFPPHDIFLNRSYSDVRSATEVFRDDALEFPPGQGFHYSTHGYTLLSAVMQQASGKPFLDLMHEILFEPVGMENTAAQESATADRLVRFYNIAEGEYGATRTLDLSSKWAGGGLVSTPSDLVHLGGALLEGDLLTPSMREILFASVTLPDGAENPQAYALGWRHHETTNILGEDRPVDVVHHGGTSKGAAAFLLLVPEHGLSIAFLTNGLERGTRRELQRLAYRVAAIAIEAQSLDQGIALESTL